jgi:hypothetical protein
MTAVVSARWIGAIASALLAAALSSSCAAASHPTGGSASRTPDSPGRTAAPGSSASASPRFAGPLAGLLLIADRGNNRLLLVDSRKRVVWRYPRPGARPSFPFRYPDDAFFGPGYHTIISNQEDQHTIQVLSFPAGRVLWHYGHPNVPGSASGFLNRPDDAYLLPDGTRSVADILNDRVLLISPRGRVLRQYGTTGVAGHAPPRQLGSPNGDTPLPGGGMLITEISGSWIDAVSAHGRLLWAVHAPVAYPSDAQILANGHILLCDYSKPGRVLIIDRRGRVLWRYRPTSGPGTLNQPSLALALPGGLIAVNDDHRHRVVLISMRTRRIVWQYGHTDHAGSARGFLNTPDGIDFLPSRALVGGPALSAPFRPTGLAPGAGSQSPRPMPPTTLPFTLKRAS